MSKRTVSLGSYDFFYNLLNVSRFLTKNILFQNYVVI